MANKELVDAVKKSGAQALADYRAKKPREHIDLAGAIFPEAPRRRRAIRLYMMALSGGRPKRVFIAGV